MMVFIGQVKKGVYKGQAYEAKWNGVLWLVKFPGFSSQYIGDGKNLSIALDEAYKVFMKREGGRVHAQNFVKWSNKKEFG